MSTHVFIEGIDGVIFLARITDEVGGRVAETINGEGAVSFFSFSRRESNCANKRK